MKEEKIWVLLMAINEYCQEGEYLITAWRDKPSIKDLEKVLPFREIYELQLILENRGRTGFADVWYYLEELSFGEIYKHKNV